MTDFIGTFYLSLPGISHERLQIPCQDSSLVDTLENGWVIAAIADGLGSAVHSKIGSQIAVDTVVDTFKASGLSLWNEEEIHTLFLSAFEKALQEISERATQDGNPITEYDTTLTSVLYNGDQAFFLHVGDGGVITLSKDGDYSIITSAQKGDAFNEVVPLRMGKEIWQFGCSKTGICSILMMTDGIFDVACPAIYAQTNKPVRINYVRQFMDVSFMKSRGLQLETTEDFKTLQELLIGFYSGEGSEDITDDKTILGIIHIAAEYIPTEKDFEYYKNPDISKIIEAQNKRLYENKERESEVEKNRLEVIERDRKTHAVVKISSLSSQKSPVNNAYFTPSQKKGDRIRQKRIDKKYKEIERKRGLKIDKRYNKLKNNR